MLQLAGAGSTLGIWAYGVALPVFAYHAGGARAVGLLFFARYALAAAAAPWLGVLADRWSRRQLMLTADLVRVAIFAVMTTVAALDGPAMVVFVLAVLSTIISGAYQPAQAALIPTLVDSPDELTGANLVANTIAGAGAFAGPAVGGVLLALSGPDAVFALTGALYLWSAAFVLGVPRDARPERLEHARILPELVAGMRTVVRRPALRVVVGLSAGHTLVAGALAVLVVVLALPVLDAGNAGVGWLDSAFGIGGLIGASSVAVIAARRRLASGFAAGLLLWGVPLALTPAWAKLGVALFLIGLVGAGGILVEVLGVTLIQRSTENEILGRVFGVLQSIALGTLALGSLAAPGLVSWLGPRGALVAAGLLLPVVLAPLWPRLRAIDAAATIAEEPLALLRGIPIFAPLPEPVLEGLAAGAAAVTVDTGQTVVEQGAPGDRFYAIAAGRASTEVDGERVAELGPGDFFGEIALLRDVPRTATVRAIEALSLFAIERDAFLTAVTGHAPSHAAAESVVVARLPASATL